jgi:uracil-DNA glycosylase
MAEITGRSALDFLPPEMSYPALKAAADGCMGCDLYKNATQTVFGEGEPGSDILFVGEQPGDEEDLSGHPFVGPSGRLFDKALAEAGIDRDRTYVTNAVKHFKWVPKGQRRLHAKPKTSEVAACLPWLSAEVQIVNPRIVVCLGATAAQALLGNAFRVTKDRGKWLPSSMAEKTIATVHPSSVLRARDSESREKQYKEFVADLIVVSAAL